MALEILSEHLWSNCIVGMFLTWLIMRPACVYHTCTYRMAFSVAYGLLHVLQIIVCLPAGFGAHQPIL